MISAIIRGMTSDAERVMVMPGIWPVGRRQGKRYGNDHDSGAGHTGGGSDVSAGAVIGRILIAAGTLLLYWSRTQGGRGGDERP